MRVDMKLIVLLIVGLSVGCLRDGVARSASGAVIAVDDNGFEYPNQQVGPNAYSYASNTPAGDFAVLPTTGLLAFNSTAGIAANGSLFDLLDAPNGNGDGTVSAVGQAGFLQSYHGSSGTITETIYIPSGLEGDGTLSFLQEPRASGDELLIVLDNSQLVDIDNPYLGETLQSPAVEVPLGDLAVGYHTIEFLAVEGGADSDLTTFIDSLSVTTTPVPVPEPAALGVMGAILLALCGLGGRSRGRGLV
jgi:hypothetical protein